MRRRKEGLEAFTGPELSGYIAREHGGVVAAQRGSHITYRLPDGREVGSLLSGYVPSVMARVVAKKLGMTYPELRAALGHPVLKRGRPRRQRVEPTSPPPITKADVIGALDDLQAEVGDLNAIKFGQRDPAFYRKAYETLIAARRELERMPRPLATWKPEATS